MKEKNFLNFRVYMYLLPVYVAYLSKTLCTCHSYSDCDMFVCTCLAVPRSKTFHGRACEGHGKNTRQGAVSLVEDGRRGEEDEGYEEGKDAARM